MLHFVKPGDFVHVRRADESPVKTIRPAMVWALNRLPKLAALILAQPGSAVAADIVEGAHFPG